jgi:hypothetical protein
LGLRCVDRTKPPPTVQYKENLTKKEEDALKASKEMLERAVATFFPMLGFKSSTTFGELTGLRLYGRDQDTSLNPRLSSDFRDVRGFEAQQ